MKRSLRWIYASLAYGFLALAAAGIFLPGLPTVPFLLLAAWAAARGSERLHDWLHRHEHFGTLLRQWNEQGAVPVKAKWAAVVLLGLSWTVLVFHSDGAAVPLITGGLFLAVAAFLLTRPSPAPLAEKTDGP